MPEHTSRDRVAATDVEGDALAPGRAGASLPEGARGDDEAEHRMADEGGPAGGVPGTVGADGAVRDDEADTPEPTAGDAPSASR